LLLLRLHLLLEFLLSLPILIVAPRRLTFALLVLALLISCLICKHLHLLLKHLLRLQLLGLSLSFVRLSLRLELLSLLRRLRFLALDHVLLHPLLGLIRLLNHEFHPLLHILIDLLLGQLLGPRALLHTSDQLHDHLRHL